MSITISGDLQSNGTAQRVDALVKDSNQKVHYVFQSMQLEQMEQEIQEIMSNQPKWPREAAVAIYQEREAVKAIMRNEGLSKEDAEERHSRDFYVRQIMQRKGVSQKVAEAEYDALA